MGKKNFWDPDQDQEQDQKQDQRQAELQAQLQGQLQGQGQGQAQGQAQFALQHSENKSENENDNDNKNSNENKNELENKVENENKNENSNENKNVVESKVDNDIENKIENHVENKVETDVDVDVKVDLDLDGWEPTDDDVIDIDWIKDIDGSVIMPDAVSQTMGNGNQFNIDQVNNLVDKDFLWHAENSGSVTQDVKAEGGEAKIDDVKAEVDGARGTMGDAGTATADAVASAEGYAQSIVMGANIQFNNIEMTVAGSSLTTADGDDNT